MNGIGGFVHVLFRQYVHPASRVCAWICEVADKHLNISYMVEAATGQGIATQEVDTG